jgi:hypothetical protein
VRFGVREHRLMLEKFDNPDAEAVEGERQNAAS